MGGCPMGGYGWGKVSERDLKEAVHAALDNGVNFFDTADTYGLGKSEEILGDALKGMRSSAIIATKFGVRVINGKTIYDNSPSWIVKAVQASLKRLGTDYIDLYQIHYRDGKTPLDDVLETLENLKHKGYIRYFGLSNIKIEELDELRQCAGRFVSVQEEYSLACRKNEYILTELADEIGLTPLTWGSLGHGVLTGKYDIQSTFGADDRRSREVYVNFHGEKLKKNLEIVEVMRGISRDNGKSLPAIAIRFIMDRIKNSIALVGVKSSDQLRSNIEAIGWYLTQRQMEDLSRVSEDSRGDAV
jgi:aryl-alcohol dehydrogenase-like predicted oxidoreductase